MNEPTTWLEHRGAFAEKGPPARRLSQNGVSDDALHPSSSSWLSKPAVAIPQPPPGRTALASVYDTKGSRVLGMLQTALVFIGICVYVGFTSKRSALIPSIVLSCVGYWLIMLGNPARAIVAGDDWLGVVPASRGDKRSWVATNRLSELRLAGRRGPRLSLELRDQHGRTVCVSLRGLRSNELLFALFMKAVRQSHRAGMRVDETAARVLFLDMPVLGDEISVDEQGRPTVTYFAVHLVQDGPREPITVIRRTPGRPFPIDETINERGQWERDGYLYQSLGIPDGFAFSKISERRALAFVEAIRNEVEAERNGGTR